MNETKTNILVSIMGMFQKHLSHINLLQNSKYPIKTKNQSEFQSDALALYEFLAQKLYNVSEHQLNIKKENFNTIARKLSDDYYLNMYVLALFMLETYLESEPKHIYHRMIPKVKRNIQYMRKNIIKENENRDIKGQAIMQDSKIGSSNIMRIFSKQPELTKEIRTLNLNKWKNISNNSKKETA